MNNIESVPLKSLRISPLNVRKSNLNEDIVSLAEDIAAHGLLTILDVVDVGEGIYEVVAGARRYQALWYLYEQCRLEFDQPVPVLVVPEIDGRAVSLSENIHRIAMNPADEYLAFRAIVGDHGGEEDPIGYCARRFGATRAHVEGRLRLADLADEVMDALRDGRVSADAAKAYAVFADHKLQLQVFNAEEKRSWGNKHEPRAIRDAMKSKTYPIDIAQAKYVGIEQYIAAGGRTERELFMGADEGERITDPALLDKLARDKADAQLPALVKRDGFAKGLLTQGFSVYPPWPKQPAGFERLWTISAPSEIAKKERKAAIGVYTLATDGSGIRFHGAYRPAAERDEGSPYKPETSEQRAARQRAVEVTLRAARLAVPAFAGTDLEGRAFWPKSHWVAPVSEEQDGIYVAVLFRVSAEDLEAHKGEAEQLLDAESAAADEAKNAAADTAETDADANDRVDAAEGEQVDG